MIPDIYFEEKYARLYEKIEGGVFTKIDFEDENGSITHMFIKRKIPNTSNLYDLITPYGYGGPLINSIKTNKEKLVDAFNVFFDDYAKKYGIVSEFVRFHPLIENHVPFKSMYNAKEIRNTVVTNIEQKDTFSHQFSKSTRKKIRKLIKDDYQFRYTKSLSEFIKIYYDTMERNAATEFYYFDNNYFYELSENFNDNYIVIEIVKDGVVVSSGLYLVYNEYMHAHLSGTLKEYIYDSPAYLIKYAAVLWAEEANLLKLFHGGGTSNSLDNGVYRFKKRFATNTEDKPFYIGKKIWQNDLYDQLVSSRKENLENVEFFPLYRY